MRRILVAWVAAATFATTAGAAEREVTACWGRGWSGSTRATLYCDHTGGQDAAERTPTIAELYAEGWRLIDVEWVERANDRGPTDWVYYYLEREKK